MKTHNHVRPEPAASTVRGELGDRGAGCAAPGIGGPMRLLALCLGSIAVMAPWPLLGILLTHTSFDRSSEAFMLFGGFTLFPLMLLALFGTVPEAVFIVILMLVWLAAAVVPGLWLGRRLRSWPAIVALLVVQVVFSIAQAGMGALLVFGKNV